MISILKTQLFRIKKSGLYWTLLGVSAGLPILSVLLLLGVCCLFGSFDEAMQMLASLGVTSFSSMAEFIGYSTDASLFAMICSSILLSREFTQGTVRNAILANKSRTQLYFAYLLTALFIGGSYFVASFATTTLAYGVALGFGDVQAGVVATTVLCDFTLGLLSVVFVQTCVCMFLFVTRKQAGTIAFPLVVCLFAPGIIVFIEEMFLLNVYINGNIPSTQLLQCLPFLNMQATTVGEESLIQIYNVTQPAGLNVGMIALYDLLFSGMFFAIGFNAIRKADLK